MSVLERVPSAVRVTACATFAPTLLQLGLPDKAHQLLLSAIEIDPHNAMCWKLLMELELKQGTFFAISLISKKAPAVWIPLILLVGTTSAANTLSHFEKAVKLSHPPDINLWVMYIQWLVCSLPAIITHHHHHHFYRRHRHHSQQLLIFSSDYGGFCYRC